MEKAKKIAIALLIVLLIAIIAAVVLTHQLNKDKPLETTTAKRTTMKATTTTTVVTPDGDAGLAFEEDNTEVSHAMIQNVRKIKGKWAWCDDDQVATSFTGAMKCTIEDYSSKEQYYYFTNGYLDTKFKGLAPIYTDETWIYIEKGHINTNFSGLVSYNHYLRVIKDGYYYKSYTGKIELPNATTDVVEGAVYGFGLGYEDNYIYLPAFAFLDDGSNLMENYQGV